MTTEKDKGDSLLWCIYNSGLWRFLPFVLIYSIGFATVFPVIPTVITNGFASAAAGYPIDCQEFSPETAPKECRDAHAQAVTWGSWTSFVSGSILSFFLSPIIGYLSDQWGRKPFMLAGIVLTFLPMTVILANLWGWLTIYWYFPASAANGVISSITLVLTSVADLMRPSHRAVSVAFITAMFSIGLIVGPLLGGYLQALQSVYVCLGLTAVTWFYVLLLVPEPAPTAKSKQAAAAAAAQQGRQGGSSRSSSNRAEQARSGSRSGARAVAIKEGQASEHTQPLVEASAEDEEAERGEPGAAAGAAAGRKLQPGGLLSGWKLLLGSSWYCRLAVIWVLICMMTAGVQEVLMQYLQLTLGFNTRDQAQVYVVIASCSLAVKITALGLLVRYLGERGLLVVGLVAFVAEYLLLAQATSRIMALTAVGVGATAAVTWPAMVALQSSRASPSEQGQVAGVLQGVGSLASGVGPVVFAFFFSAFTKTDAELPYWPQVVWYIAAGIGVVTMILTLTLYWGPQHEKPSGHTGHSTQADAMQAGEDHDWQQRGGLEPQVKAEEEAEVEGSSSAGAYAPVAMGRSWSIRSSLQRLGSIYRHSKEDRAARSQGSRGTRARAAGQDGEGLDVEQLLLLPVDEEVGGQRERP